MFQKILMAALVAAPLMLVPAHVDAQQRGPDRAAVAQENRPSEAPEGLRKAMEGRTPPAALQRLFPNLAPGARNPARTGPRAGAGSCRGLPDPHNLRAHRPGRGGLPR